MNSKLRSTFCVLVLCFTMVLASERQDFTALTLHTSYTKCYASCCKLNIRHLSTSSLMWFCHRLCLSIILKNTDILG
uniref:Uncharacterized protein n=1 Tax=Octopus bimaculoides TaxID=37653 RepID=A0A0L8HXZ1_OCTBM